MLVTAVATLTACMGIGSELVQWSMMALNCSSLFMASGERPKLLPKTNETEMPYRPRIQSTLIISNTMRVVELRHCVLIRPGAIANNKRM